jgi:hypothetical protein
LKLEIGKWKFGRQEHAQTGMKRVYELDIYKPAEALSDMIRRNLDKRNKIECVHQQYIRVIRVICEICGLKRSNKMEKRAWTGTSRLVICFLFLAGIMASGCSQEGRLEKHFKKGEEYFSQSKFKEAAIEFKNVIQIDPRSATAHYRLGIIYLRQKNIREGYRELTKCVEIDPDMMEAQLTLANIYLLSRDFERSREKAEMILEKEPDNVTARLILANVIREERR